MKTSILGEPLPKAILMLEDGTIFNGVSCASDGEACGRVVCNTAVSGYQETITNPANAGILVCFTYPQIGNYGINDEDSESSRVQTSGLIMRDMCTDPSNWRATTNLPDFLKENDIVAIDRVMTRDLTLHLREHGSQCAIISTTDFDPASLKEKLDAFCGEEADKNLVAQVATDEVSTLAGNAPEGERHTVIVDLGIGATVVQTFVDASAKVTLVPWNSNTSDILALEPSLVFLSDGPGDPGALEANVQSVKDILGQTTLLGVGLGALVLAQAAGATIIPLKQPHHGVNHPIKHLACDGVVVSQQNCLYQVDSEAPMGEIKVTDVDLNDNMIAGFKLEQQDAYGFASHSVIAEGFLNQDGIGAWLATREETCEGGGVHA